MEKRKQGMDGRIKTRFQDRRTAVDTGKKGIVRNSRGEALTILMAAMMIGGFLFWLTMGHAHGMHGGTHGGGDSRTEVAAGPGREPPLEAAVRGDFPARIQEEGLENDPGVR